jgi:glycine cleavage system H protein
MEFPDDLRYTREHEWVRVDGDVATVGITDFAQDALGDVVFVELPAVGVAVAAHAACCEVESTKSVSEIYAPIAGTVVAVNDELTGTPELLNSDPYGEGWIFRLEVAEPGQLEGLLDAAGYRATLDTDS